MKSDLIGADFPIVLHSGDQALFIQLYESLKASIVNGTVAQGTILPSTRDLARRLGVSRHTVLKATKLLVTQGYLDGSETGLTVCWRGDLEFAPDSATAEASAREPAVSRVAQRTHMKKRSNPGVMSDFSIDVAALSSWRKIMIDKSREFKYSDANSLGCESLRRAISRYLNRFRSLRSTPDNVVVFQNSNHLRYFLKQLLLDANDGVIVENPCSAFVLDELEETSIHPVSVDSHGMCVSTIASPAAKCLFVTPAHHNPTGATMSLDRRIELIDWAFETETLIIEDAFDSSFTHKGRPLPPLQALDQTGNVIYISSFEQVIGQLSKMAFAVFPSAYMPVVHSLLTEVGASCSLIEQESLAAFLDKGLYERHLRASNRELSMRRQQLIIALMKTLGSKISIAPQSCGTWLTVKFMSTVDPRDIENSATESGLTIESTAPLYLTQPVLNQYIIPFTSDDASRLVSSATAFGVQLAKLTGAKAEAAKLQAFGFQPASFVAGSHRL